MIDTVPIFGHVIERPVRLLRPGPRWVCLIVWTLLALLLPVRAVSADLELADGERRWLAEHPVIRVAPDPGFAPVEFLDSGGQYRGIASEYLAQLERLLGIDFEILAVDTWSEALALGREREADVFAAIVASPERSQFLSFTTPYLRLPGAIVTRRDLPQGGGLGDFVGRRVGVVSGSIWHELTARDYPRIDSVALPHLESALAQLSSGALDAVVANLASVSYHLRQTERSELRLAAETGYEVEYSLGVRADWPELVTILNRAQRAISADDTRAMVAQWVGFHSAGSMLAPVSADAQDEALTKDAVRAKILELEQAEDLEPAARASALELYGVALDRLEAARAAERRSAVYVQAIEDAPVEARRLRSETRVTRERLLVEAVQDLDIAELEQRLTLQQGEVDSLQARLSGLLEEIAQEQARPDTIRKRLAEQQAGLRRVGDELASPAPFDEPGFVADARRVSLRARKRAHQALVDSLEQELLSHSARLELLQARRERLEQTLAYELERLRRLQDQVDAKRASEAEQLRMLAEEARRRAAEEAPVVREAVEANALLIERLAGLSERLQWTGGEKDRVNADLQEIEEIYQSAREQLELAGQSEALGEALRAQRERLPNIGRYKRSTRERKKQMAESRLEQLRVEDQRRRLRSIGLEVDRMLEGSRADTAPGATPTLRLRLRVVLEERRDLLDRLWHAYNRYIAELRDLELVQRRFIDRAQDYADLLEKRLLWVASSEPLDGSWLPQLAISAGRLVAPSNWTGTFQSMLRGLLAQPVLSAAVLILIGAALASRGALHRRRELIASKVAEYSADSMALTFQALAILVLYVAPWSVLMAYLAWSISQYEASTVFALAVAAGLAEIAAVLFVVAGLQQMSRDGGLADVHFEWPTQMRSTLWRGLRWLKPALLPTVFVVTVTEFLPDEIYRNGIGRLAFVIASLALAVFAFTVLAPSSLAASGTSAQRHVRWVALARYVVTAIPLAFAGLAVWGYYYTAVRLEYRVFLSLLVVAAAILVHSLLSRWLILVQRRLTRARVRAARESLAAGHRAGEPGGGGSEILEVNLLATGERTQKLVGLAVAGLTLLGIWFTWREVIPALAILDDVTLWHRSALVEGVANLVPVTLADLLASLAVAALTFVAGRSLPSLLELSMLPRLRLAPGTLYAISTLSQYAVITVGVIVSLNILGIGWGQVQWLVAAVGVGLGFGLREMFASLFAGLVILFERPIRVGDVVSIGELTGTVSRIRIRATTVTDWDNREMVIPNYLLINEKLTNWTLNDAVTRLVVKVIVAFGSDVERARELMMETAKAHPLVLSEPEPKVLFLGFGEHGLEFELWVFARGIEERFALTDELHTELNRRFHEQGIEVALPRLDVRVRPDEEGVREERRPSSRLSGSGPRPADPGRG